MAKQKFETKSEIAVHISNFDGPLDLLLHLIKEAKIDIKDIFISEVTTQYLSYLHQLDEVDFSVASEFIEIAATIIEIKTKALLPKFEDFEKKEDGESDEDRLIRRLKEYKIFKEACMKLKESEMCDKFYKEPCDSAFDVRTIIKDMNMEGLIIALTKLLGKLEQKKVDKEKPKEIQRETFTVEQKTSKIVEFMKERKTASFYELFDDSYTREEVIVTFLALLELLHTQFVIAVQYGTYDDINITIVE